MFTVLTYFIVKHTPFETFVKKKKKNILVKKWNQIDIHVGTVWKIIVF